MLRLIRLVNKIFKRKPIIYQVKLMDGLVCELGDIEWVQRRKGEYRFYAPGKNEPLLACPKANVSNIQQMDLVEDNREELHDETQIDNAIPPEKIRMEILDSGKKEVARFLIRKESGRVWLWDSAKDVYTSVDEGSEALIREVVGMANAEHQEGKLDDYKETRDKEATIKLIITDVDEKPSIAVGKQAWDAMLKSSEYKPIMAPVVENLRGQQFRFDADEKQVSLTRCLLVVEGDNVKRMDMEIPK